MRQDSSVTTGSRPRDGRRECGVILQADADVPFITGQDRLWLPIAQSVAHLMCTDGSFQGESDKNLKGHSLALITHVKNAWNYTCTILHICVVWRQIYHRYKFELHTFSSSQMCTLGQRII